MSLKKKFINLIIEREGGYVNDPSDSGGETMFGITKETAGIHGYRGAMQDLPRSVAFFIYSSSFWDAQRLSEVESLAPSIAEELADTGVNMHPHTAGVFLQRCLNVLNNIEKYYKDIEVDGYIGSKTIQSLQYYLDKRGKEGEEVLLGMLNSLQGAKYIQLAEQRIKDEKFIYGWFLQRIVEPIKAFFSYLATPNREKTAQNRSETTTKEKDEDK